MTWMVTRVIITSLKSLLCNNLCSLIIVHHIHYNIHCHAANSQIDTLQKFFEASGSSLIMFFYQATTLHIEGGM